MKAKPNSPAIAFQSRIAILTDQNRRLRLKVVTDQQLIKRLISENRRLKIASRDTLNETEGSRYQEQVVRHQQKESLLGIMEL